MKKILNSKIPRYQKNTFDELMLLLSKTIDSREKAPIIITLSVIDKSQEEKNAFLNEMFKELINPNNDSLIFGNKTTAMIAAMTILDNGSDKDVKNLLKQVKTYWSQTDINTFINSMKKENIHLDV